MLHTIILFYYVINIVGMYINKNIKQIMWLPNTSMSYFGELNRLKKYIMTKTFRWTLRYIKQLLSFSTALWMWDEFCIYIIKNNNLEYYEMITGVVKGINVLNVSKIIQNKIKYVFLFTK